MSSSEILKGVVVSTFWPKSYAFLRQVESRREYFFHKTDVTGPTPQVGDLVTFTVGQREGREKAFTVRLVQPSDKALSILSGADGDAGGRS